MDDLSKQIAEKVIADTKYFTAIIGFLGVIIGAVISILGNIILHRLTAKKERQHEILKRELDRLYRLEEIAGEIAELAGSYQLDDHLRNELKKRFQKSIIAAGTFRKHPKLKQAIRDLNQYAMILVSDTSKDRDTREDRKELEKIYEAFLSELKIVFDGIKI